MPLHLRRRLCGGRPVANALPGGNNSKLVLNALGHSVVVFDFGPVYMNPILAQELSSTTTTSASAYMWAE